MLKKPGRAKLRIKEMILIYRTKQSKLENPTNKNFKLLLLQVSQPHCTVHPLAPAFHRNALKNNIIVRV